MLTPDAIINGSQLYHGDCFEVMRNLPPASVDMVFADIPYNMIDSAWDKLPFDLPLMWECLEPLVKPKGAIIMTAVNPFSSVLVMSNIQNYRHEWVWDKKMTSGYLNAKKMPMRGTEQVLVFGRESVNYYPLKTRRDAELSDKAASRGGSTASECFSWYQTREDYRMDFHMKHPAQIIRASFRGKNSNAGISERGAHPTQKPIDLMAYLIRTYSRPGETVLDFTMGSGSTGLAAMETGRSFIGIERDKKHFNTSRWRMEQVKDVYGEDAAAAFELQHEEEKIQPQDGLFDKLLGLQPMRGRK